MYVHSQAVGMLVVCVGTALPGLGLSPGTQVCASVGLSMADSKHPACMPTWACVTPLRVRVPAVSGCICQGLLGYTCRRGPVLEHLVSPEGTVLLTSQNMPGALV